MNLARVRVLAYSLDEAQRRVRRMRLGYAAAIVLYPGPDGQPWTWSAVQLSSLQEERKA